MSMINQRIRRSLVLATVVAALAAPAAWAAPVDPVENGSYPSVDSGLGEPTPVSGSPVSTGDGFDWGDAGLGAGAMLGLTAMVAGSALALRHRPQRGHTVA